MDISSALSLLRDTPVEVLQHHTGDALSTLLAVEHRLKGLLHHKESETRGLFTCSTCKRAFSSTPGEENGASKSTDLSDGTGSSDRRSAGVQPGIVDSTGNARKRQSRSNVPDTAITAPSRAAALLKALIKVIPCARDFMKSEPIHVIYKKRTHRGDRRLDDILRVEGNKQASNEDRLFRGLAQRSLAIQYSQFQRRSGQYPRVDELCDDISSQVPAEQRGDLHKRRGGNISRWARRHLTFIGEDGNMAARCVNAGIKQLVIERLLQQRLERTSQSINASGISAFTALAGRNFKNLCLKEIPSFLDCVSAESSIVSLPLEMPCSTVQRPNTRSLHILDIIGEVSQWFESFQRNYDGKIPSPASIRWMSLMPFLEDCSVSNDQIQGSQPAPPKPICLASPTAAGDNQTDNADGRASTEERVSRGRSETGQAQLGVNAADTVNGADYQEMLTGFNDGWLRASICWRFTESATDLLGPTSNHLISAADTQSSDSNRFDSADGSIGSSPKSHASFEVAATSNSQSNIHGASVLAISDSPSRASHNEPCAIEHTGCTTTHDISAHCRYPISQASAGSQEGIETRRKRRRTRYHSGISTTSHSTEGIAMGSSSNSAGNRNCAVCVRNGC